jgi:hypothetical protein
MFVVEQTDNVPFFMIGVDSMIKITKITRWATVFPVAMCFLAANAHAASSTVVGFDGGSDGGFSGNAFFEAAGGNPGGNAHHDGPFFFNELRTGGVAEPANPAFLGDFSPFSEVTFSFDIKVDSIGDFIGNQIVRPIGIRLTDRDIIGNSGPSGVFFELPFISAAAQPDWTEFSVTIDDPTSAILPPGWIGFGEENLMTAELGLPPGATFATVLASVDEFAITGAVPGFFFTDAFYDIRIDNVAVLVPEPGSCVLLLAGLLAIGYRER